jgi:hypothetical protein
MIEASTLPGTSGCVVKSRTRFFIQRREGKNFCAAKQGNVRRTQAQINILFLNGLFPAGHAQGTRTLGLLSHIWETRCSFTRKVKQFDYCTIWDDDSERVSEHVWQPGNTFWSRDFLDCVLL